MAASHKNEAPTLSISKATVQSVESSINSKLSALPTGPGKSYTVCIYRVSGKHRKVNIEAYTPRLVSVGPLHHGRSELQAMEAYKLSCLRSFVAHYQVNMTDLANFAFKEESFVRGCYEDTFTFSPHQFTELILLDGIFVVDLLLKSHAVHRRDRSDALYENRWMQKDVLHDMLLLENQLPISYIRRLFTKFVTFEPRHEFNFDDLVLEYYKDVGNTKKMGNAGKPSVCTEARHLIEFLVYLHWPPKSKTETQTSPTLPTLPVRKFEYTRSAAELEEAGVTFKRGTECLFNVTFINGELVIPHLKVNDNTETFFRNAVAFEQCGYYGNNITSYVILMDSLINTGKDVDLLVKYNIIENWLGESEKVADMFNNLYKEVVANEKDFYFADTCDKLNTYSKDKWHEWKASRFKWNIMLKRDYFGNPWSIISVAAAIFLLGLTVTQTVCSLLALK